MRLSRLSLWLCLAAGAPAALAQPAAAWGLPQLMQNLARVRSASASFTERTTVQVLSVPLLTSGSLTYVAPGYVRKTTVAPILENFVLDHGQVTMTGGPDHQTHVFSLTDDPRIGGLIEGIRATLAGDLPALQRFYNLRLSGNATNWQLLLQPKDAALTRFLKWMLIKGSQNRIDAIDTASGDGDHSEMAVTEDVGDAG